ncbi:MAG: DMT family transporter [Candidatus Aenigmatarchaeota archaeon]
MADERMEIGDVKLFLRYALPCADTLVSRGWVEKDVVELELEKAAVTGEAPGTEIRDIFTVAYARCSLIAKQLGKASIDAEVIRMYFWDQHDQVIEERHKEMKDFDKEACRVLPGKVANLSPLVVEAGPKKMNSENPYNIQLKVGDYVVLHYSRIVEKLTPLQYNGLRKKVDAPESVDVAERATGMDKKEIIGTALAFLTACVSGIAIFANKMFIVDMDPALFTAIRALVIGLIFLILSFASGAFSPGKKKIPWGWLFLVGVIGGGVAFLMFFTGLKLTTSGRAGFLHKTLPLWVSALAIPFLKEKVTRKQALAMAFMFGGTLIMLGSSISITDMWANPFLGDLLVIGATVLWAVENVVARKLLREGETNFLVTFGRMFFGAVFLFGVIGLTGRLGALTTLTTMQITNIMISTGLLFVYVFFYYWSLKHINVSKAAAILLAAPVVTLLLGWGFLNEPVPATQIVGSGAILVGGFLIAKVKSEFQTC